MPISRELQVSDLGFCDRETANLGITQHSPREVPAGRGHRRTPSRDHDGVQCSNARNIACVVVGDLPLRQDIALSAVFDARAGRRLPPFLCGITEFEMLVELGPTGLSVPSVACAWQYSGTDMSLGLYLANHPAA